LPPRLSAIVPLVEFNDYGRRCVRSLLEVPGVEVVLVPDAEPDGLDPRVVCVPSGDAHPGIKRQLGLDASSGSYVGLIDDDAYPGTGWPEAAIAELERDRELGAIAGPALTPDDEPRLGKLSGRIFASMLVMGPHKWRNAQVPARDVDDAPSVNLVMPREVATTIGLDTPSYPGEDTVMCARILDHGWRIRYIPDSVVLHSRRPLWYPHLRQLYRWSRRRGAFARRGGRNSRRPAYYAPTVLLLGIAGGAFTRGPLRALWRIGLASYVATVVLAGRDRDAGNWWRISGGIAATHVVYGTGFLISMLGVRLPEDRT